MKTGRECMECCTTQKNEREYQGEDVQDSGKTGIGACGRDMQH